MKVFIVLSCIALAVAKPQGYSYQQPSHGLGVSAPQVGLSAPLSAPAPSFTGASSFSSASFSAPSFSAPSFVPSQPAPSYSAPVAHPAPSYSAPVAHPAPSYSAPIAQQSFAPVAQQSFAPAPVAHQSFAPAPVAQQSFAPAPVAQPSFAPVSQPSFQSFQPQPAPQAVIQKHIYVHVPPPDAEEDALAHRNAPVVQAQKHYKIIFIKAPSAPSLSHQQLAQLSQQQSEEKTLVYVLVKKPESLEELAQNLPAPAPIAPSKPEVYFIKYKAQREQHAAPVLPAAPIANSAPSFPIDSGSDVASLPIASPVSVPVPVQKPAPVYGPAH